MQMHIMDSERQFATFEYKDSRAPSQLCMLNTTDEGRGLLPGRDELVVELNGYKGSSVNLETKVSEQNVFVKAGTGSAIQLEKKTSSSQDKTNLFQRKNEN